MTYSSTRRRQCAHNVALLQPETTDMEIPAPNFRVTPYGDVDAEALAALRDTYDTAMLLEWVKRTSEVANQSYTHWVEAQGRARYIITLLARKITADQLARVTHVDREALQAFDELAATFSEAAQQVRPLVALRPEQGE